MANSRNRKRNSKISNKGKSKQNQEERLYKINSRIVMTLVFIVAIGVVSQMVRWQIFEHDRFLTIATSQYKEAQRQQSGRGKIISSDGTILATDQPAWNVYASLSSIDDERSDFFDEKERFVAEVASILQMDKNNLDDLLTDDFRYIKLGTNISSEEKKALESKQIFQATYQDVNDNTHYKRYPGFGLHFEKSEKRVYPDGRLASHIVGFMGKDDEGMDQGLYGIEGYYFGDLSGRESYTYEEQDVNGNVILTSEYDPVLPREGKDIKLTIQSTIQEKVETVLKHGVERYQAKSGTVIIMDPNTGAIIAMANYPDYNPNEYWKTSEPWIFKNKAVGDVYEPGSVFKPLTVAIGLETDAITPETKCYDHTGYIKIFEGTPDEKTIYTWDKKPDGVITPREYLKYSNNPCIATTALEIGHEQYYPKMREFGIGEFIGTGLQDETNAYVLPYEYWTKLDLAVTSFGQSISTTPLQILSAVSAIANEGKRMRPYIVDEVIEGEEVIQYNPTVASTPISPETASIVAEMMTSVPREGDGHYYFNEYLPDYDIAGKTGTAQIPKTHEVGYYNDRTNTTFIGFAPSQNAQMIMLIRLEEPQTDGYSASNVVPLWVETFMNIADDLEIPTK